MAKIDVKTIVTAPSEINIPLIRADHAGTSNVFRICFEISLSIFSTLLGYMLGLKDPQPIHWAFIAVAFGATISFLLLGRHFSKESKVA
jgi:purine-cytosine permease-like protein